MTETTQQKKTTQLVSRNETTQLVSRNETTQLCTAVDRLQQPATTYKRLHRLFLPSDLTPLDYFLWGYIKSSVYADKPQTLDALEDNIRRVIADIRPQMLEKVIENWTSRLDYIRASRGSPMPEIKFKM
ncbi:transposable element Tc3 transposase [Trichonephila clavipes]|nr:transposable element Tc3 transposase [Trichonephila clavipes]